MPKHTDRPLARHHNKRRPNQAELAGAYVPFNCVEIRNSWPRRTAGKGVRMSAPRILTLSRHSVRADVRGKKLNLLRTAGRATQFMRKVFVQRAMIWAELLNQGVNIKPLTVVAPVAVRGNQISIPFAITQCRVRAEYPHNSLQGWLSYIENKTNTNQKLRGQIE